MRIIPFLVGSTMFLCGCTVAPVEPDGSHVGLDVEWATESSSSEEAVIQPETNDDQLLNEESLLQSYNEAATVRDIMIQVTLDMPPEARDALTPALQVFSDDVDALKYFADSIQYENLTDEETHTVLDIITDIENAMTVFNDILDLVI